MHLLAPHIDDVADGVSIKSVTATDGAWVVEVEQLSEPVEHGGRMVRGIEDSWTYPIVAFALVEMIHDSGPDAGKVAQEIVPVVTAEMPHVSEDNPNVHVQVRRRIGL